MTPLYTAVHEVHFATKSGVAATNDAPAVPPVLETAAPGEVFTPVAADVEYLLAAGAIRKPTDEELAVYKLTHREAEDEKAALKRNETVAKSVGKAAASSDEIK